MSRKGGYQIIDFKGVNLPGTEENAIKIEGITFKDCLRMINNKKRIIISGFLFRASSDIIPNDFESGVNLRLDDLIVLNVNNLTDNIKGTINIKSDDKIYFAEE